MRATRTQVNLTGDAFKALADYPRVILRKGRGRGGSIVIAGTYGDEGFTVTKRVGRRSATFTVPATFGLRAGEFSLHETLQTVEGSAGQVYVMRNPRALVHDVVNVRAYAKTS